jgi:hypothetical protein
MNNENLRSTKAWTAGKVGREKAQKAQKESRGTFVVRFSRSRVSDVLMFLRLLRFFAAI